MPRLRLLAGAIGFAAVTFWCYPLAAQLPGLGGGAGVPNVGPRVGPSVGPGTVPNVRAPNVRAPNVRAPNVRAPNAGAPSVRGPAVRTPSVQPRLGGAAGAAGDVTGAA